MLHKFATGKTFSFDIRYISILRQHYKTNSDNARQMVQTEHKTAQRSSGAQTSRFFVRACVLIRVRPGRHFQVAREIAAIPGVSSAFAVVGAADVVARVEASDLRALAAIGTKIGDLDNVSTTETFVAAEV